MRRWYFQGLANSCSQQQAQIIYWECPELTIKAGRFAPELPTRCFNITGIKSISLTDRLVNVGSYIKD